MIFCCTALLGKHLTQLLQQDVEALGKWANNNYLTSGVARTSPMLGHSMGILRLYEILRKVQKHLGGLEHALSAYAVSL